MKPIKQMLSILMLIMGCSIFSQTPEQQKLIDKALKMQDSIMQCMTLDDLIKQGSQQEKVLKADKKKVESIKENPTTKATISEDKYGKNMLSSDANTTLKGWDYGIADLVFNYHYDSRKDKVEYVKIGIINTDGTIELKPTTEVPILKPLKNFKNSNTFFDIHNPDSYVYTNEDAGFKLNSYVLVYQNEKQIGLLTIGNSEKVTLNLLTPGDLYFGDEGYLLSWVYVNEACAIKANENWKGDLSNTGTPLVVETQVVYNLNFKAGWNLVKTEVIGTYEFPNAPEEDRSRYKKHIHTSCSSIPSDATYYFRKAPQY